MEVRDSRHTQLIAALSILSVLLGFSEAFAPPRRSTATTFIGKPSDTDQLRYNKRPIHDADVRLERSTKSSTSLFLRVAYQGEPGAYSEKSTRELLGPNVLAIGHPTFEGCFQAVASLDCDYACLPIENSLGGSIHENYDLMLRYDLTIVAEHEFRVQHCLLVDPSVQSIDQLEYAISHPQALAQCDDYLRARGITPIPTYDTAGSCKMVQERNLPESKPCTPQNTAAVASDLAGVTYGLKCLQAGIEDDDSNFTRFLLLARRGVLNYLTPNIPSKTSIVYTFDDAPGSLYKSLACFSLRDIDCSKIESRPTSASLLNYLKFRGQKKKPNGDGSKTDMPRFRYCFYLDVLSSPLDGAMKHALEHLQEQANYVRVLGSFPQRSQLVGPVADAVEQLKQQKIEDDSKAGNIFTMNNVPTKVTDESDGKESAADGSLNIGIVGFGEFGQYIANELKDEHRISCMDEKDKSEAARDVGVEFFPKYENAKFLANLDIVIVSVPMTDFKNVLLELPVDYLKGKLIVDVCPLSAYPKTVMLELFDQHPEIDILSTNPMLGPSRKEFDSSSSNGILPDSRPLLFYDKIRISDRRRCDALLRVFEDTTKCQMVELSAEQHDETVGSAEFITQLAGRILTGETGDEGFNLLPSTPVKTNEYAALVDIAERVSHQESFDDIFYGLYAYGGDAASETMRRVRDNLASIDRQLAAREAYLKAKSELSQDDRQQLLAEMRKLLQDSIGPSLLRPQGDEEPESQIAEVEGDDEED